MTVVIEGKCAWLEAINILSTIANFCRAQIDSFQDHVRGWYIKKIELVRRQILFSKVDK
jgi:hypothetical protein